MIINQKKSIHRLANSRGFTLVELLVVLAILASLAAIAIPVSKSMLNKGKVTETKMRMQELESAISAYNDDNGHLPHPDGNYPTSENVSATDLTEIVTILLNLEDGDDIVNTKGKKYLLMPDAKSNNNGVIYTSNAKTTVRSIVDAWGEEFEVLMDYDLDGDITKQTFGSANNVIQNKSVIIISRGIDGDFNNNDDLYSWR